MAYLREPLLYRFTIFFGALLLFLVQPIMGKYLLPWFGGGPGVWTVCLLFFQVMLLAGYVYAHWLATRLGPRMQAWVHTALVFLSLAFLPITPSVVWKPAPGTEPVLQLLGLLVATVGLPYGMLAATGPLLQRWLTETRTPGYPFRLYALSNAGSLLALLAYPFVVEPLWSRSAQAWIWSGGMMAFAGLSGACAWRVYRGAPAGTRAVAPAAPASAAVSTPQVLGWIAFPAVASLLLAAVTNRLTTDLTPVPFLWILPLGVYLLSFILCFDHPRWYSRGFFAAVLAVGCIGTAYAIFFQAATNLATQLTVYLAVLFAACMVCHGEVCRLKPAPARLTQFYLCLAGGGAAGTFAVVVIAPLLFRDYYELQAGLCLLLVLIAGLSLERGNRALARGLAAGVVLAIFLVPGLAAASAAHGKALPIYRAAWLTFVFYAGWLAAPGLVLCWQHWGQPARPEEGRAGAWTLPAFALAMAAGLALSFVQIERHGRQTVFSARNFYGAVHVTEVDPGLAFARRLELAHGSTTHGTQFQLAARAGWPTTYYGPTAGVGWALDTLKSGFSRHIGVIGLGAGTLATYGRDGDTFTFYEINPAIAAIARSHFIFLKQSAAQTRIILGDARLELEAQARRGDFQRFDVLVLDAFSSDAIPVHLLTAEAAETYLAHLKPDGIIAVHLTNRFLDLRGVVTGLARRFQLDCLILEDKPPPEKFWVNESRWCLLTRDRELLKTRLPASPEARRALEEKYHPILWTDDHASLFSVLR